MINLTAEDSNISPEKDLNELHYGKRGRPMRLGKVYFIDLVVPS